MPCPGPTLGRELWPWVLSIGALCCWELVTYVAGFSHRHAFPTLSSLADIGFRWRAVKAVSFAVWLALGWGLMRR